MADTGPNILQANGRLSVKSFGPITTSAADQVPALDGIMVATSGAYSLKPTGGASFVSVTLVAGLMYWLPIQAVNTGGVSETGIVGLYA